LIDDAAHLTGRVLRISGGTYHVLAGDAELECSLRGRVKLGELAVAVGDRVRVERLEDGSCRISEILPRAGTLTRHGVSRRREQVIAANIDQVAAVAAVCSPDPDFIMVDRLLVLAELDGLDGLVVANKADLVEEPEALPDGFDAYADAGYEVLSTSATSGLGLDRLDRRLRGRVTVLSGQSGVGKSSLLNALMPGLDLRVGEIGERKRRGRHTTVAAALYPYGRDGCAPDGFVVDTPGLQYLALWNVEPAELSRAFPEFRPHLDRCRFKNCRHREEPECGVRVAIEAGEVSERRHRSYLTLLEESEGGA